MNPRANRWMKEILSKALIDSPRLRYLSYIPRLDTWRKQHTERYPVLESRQELYSYINAEIIGGSRINYLEFGVFGGDSMGRWTSINDDAQSRFWGFDTFSGLPEDWEQFRGGMNKGAFDVGGAFPDIPDPRVSFIKGLFQETLPTFLQGFRPDAQLVVHCDADLYSSALYVLTRCNDILVPGSIVIFDEFSSVLHEFRALEDYCSAYMRTYEVIGATQLPTEYYPHVAIRMK